MAEYATLARPYAEAVFELAKETNSFDTLSADLNYLTQLVEDATMAAIIANPKITKVVLKQVVLDICDGQISDMGKNLTQLLVDNRRLTVVSQIAVQYEELKAQHQGYIKVELVSAYEVTPEQKADLAVTLQRRLGKSIDVNVSLDTSLLGGWLVRAGDQVIDMSLKGRIKQLANELC
jgi:F-type H+-transporting ATPase subunit delta